MSFSIDGARHPGHLATNTIEQTGAEHQTGTTRDGRTVRVLTENEGPQNEFTPRGGQQPRQVENKNLNERTILPAQPERTPFINIRRSKSATRDRGVLQGRPFLKSRENNASRAQSETEKLNRAMEEANKKLEDLSFEQFAKFLPAEDLCLLKKHMGDFEPAVLIEDEFDKALSDAVRFHGPDQIDRALDDVLKDFAKDVAETNISFRIVRRLDGYSDIVDPKTLKTVALWMQDYLTGKSDISDSDLDYLLWRVMKAVNTFEREWVD